MVPMMCVDLIPVIQRHITERATVRHCLTNFQSVRSLLNHISMAVWCVEGVSAPPADIYPHETEQFRDLFLCLGPLIGPVFCSDARANFSKVMGLMTH